MQPYQLFFSRSSLGIPLTLYNNTPLIYIHTPNIPLTHFHFLFLESLLSFVAATAQSPGITNVVEGLASSGRSARALFPQGKAALITAAAAAAAAAGDGAGCLHMVLFCAEQPLPEFLPQDADAVAKVNTTQCDC